MLMTRGLDRINLEQRLYVLTEGKGYTCLGFDYTFQVSVKVARWAGVPGPDPEKLGTPEGYADYRRILDAGREHHDRSRTRCPAELTPELVGLEGRRVEVVDRWGEKRRFYVGRSTGWLPIHLEIARIDSVGGGGVVGSPFRSVHVVSYRRR